MEFITTINMDQLNKKVKSLVLINGIQYIIVC